MDCTPITECRMKAASSLRKSRKPQNTCHEIDCNEKVLSTEQPQSNRSVRRNPKPIQPARNSGSHPKLCNSSRSVITEDPERKVYEVRRPSIVVMKSFSKEGATVVQEIELSRDSPETMTPCPTHDGNVRVELQRECLDEKIIDSPLIEEPTPSSCAKSNRGFKDVKWPWSWSWGSW